MVDAVNLYLLNQNVHNGYDTFDSCIVAAESEDDARLMCPDGSPGPLCCGWARPEQVMVELIGTAIDGTESGVILASFNAG